MKKLIGLALTAALAAIISPVTALAFDDVSEGQWYSKAVDYMQDHGIISGYSGTNTFGVNDTMSRAQFATVLWRYNAPDEVASYNQSNATNTTGMDDVQNGAWYTGAADWAVANNIITGVVSSNGTKTFDPNGTLTFEQMVVILARNMASGTNASFDNYSTDVLNNYRDGNQVSSWAKPAMAWLIDRGMVAGSDGYLYPKQAVTRARAATVLYRLITGETAEPNEPETPDVSYSASTSLFSVSLPSSWADRNIRFEINDQWNYVEGRNQWRGPSIIAYENGDDYLFGIFSGADWGPHGNSWKITIGPNGWSSDPDNLSDYYCINSPHEHTIVTLIVPCDLENQADRDRGQRLAEEFAQYVTVS